jgi:hypothetical protein
MENRFEGCVFEDGAIDVARNPVVIEDRGTLFNSVSLRQEDNRRTTYQIVVIHVVCSAGNTGIV